MIQTAEAKLVAQALHSRYPPARAVTLIARLLHKALFGGRSDEVVFWAVVFMHYRGDEFCSSTEEELPTFRECILSDPSDTH